MKTLPALVIAAVVAVGLLAGVTTYQVASGSAGPGSPAASPTEPAVTAPAARTQQKPRTRVRWAPCKPPAVRQGKVCVTEEVRTVVVPAPAAAPAPAPAAPVSHTDRDDDGRGAEHAEHPENADNAEDSGNAEHAGDDDGPEHENEHESEGEHEDEDD